MTTEVKIRDLRYGDIGTCAALVGNEWGAQAAARAAHQMLKMFTPDDDRPNFYVATLADGTIVGFCGFAPTMLMKDAYDLIWIVIAPSMQGKSLGRKLTEFRMEQIAKRGGKMVSLMTQKPAFFSKFGFLSVNVLDGWTLMVKQTGRVTI